MTVYYSIADVVSTSCLNSLGDCNTWTLKLKKGFTLIRQIPLHEVKSGCEIVSFPSGFLLLVS